MLNFRTANQNMSYFENAVDVILLFWCLKESGALCSTNCLYIGYNQRFWEAGVCLMVSNCIGVSRPPLCRKLAVHLHKKKKRHTMFSVNVRYVNTSSIYIKYYCVHLYSNSKTEPRSYFQMDTWSTRVD